jgi:predicted ATPase
MQGAIRTPDQRLRVFVSSTLVELADERAAVARAIESLRLAPVMFELGARPHPPRELYRAYLAQSDIFVGLYWQRYGWIGPDMDISGLEDEFRLSDSIPRLLYVKAPAPEREARLTAMIEELQAEGTESYRTFRSARELGRLVRDDLALLLGERFSAAPTPTVAQTPSTPDSAPARSLPAVSTSLIGREQDIDEVTRLLESDGARLVTLTGPGGIGKTRLAIAIAERLQGRYPGGPAFVPLASIDDATAVLPRVAAAVGAVVEGTMPALDVVVEHLGDTKALLVLDNLEQVVDIAPDLDRLLADCPALQILATSRTVLRLRAEREYRVDPLSVPEVADTATMGQLALLPAVQLFVDRAQAVRRDFALTEDNAITVAEICRRLDGLPLAIELAAARTRLLSPDAILARIGSHLDALGTGPVDLPERQRTIRATVEWSFDLLDDAELHLLAALSVFEGGWTIEAATPVADLAEDTVLDLLDALSGHSLVHVDVSEASPRFAMLAPVRELAAERLAAASDEAEVKRRHAEHFGALLENADWPSERQTEWAERLRPDEENIRVAVRWFLANDIAPLPHIFRILWLYWQMRGQMPEGCAWIRQARRRADTLDERGQAELLFTSAVTAVEVGDDETAIAAIEPLERLVGHIGDPYLESAAQLAISWILPLVDDFDGAHRAALSALDGLRDQDEPFVAFAALTAGMVEKALGENDTARAHFRDAENLASRFGNNWLEATTRSQLAVLAVRAGDLEGAHVLLDRLGSASDGADQSVLTTCFALAAAAELAVATGEGQRAAMALGAADGLRRRAGLQAWPSTRRGEADLAGRITQAIGTNDFEAAFAAGAGLGRREALALVRGGDPTESPTAGHP